MILTVWISTWESRKSTAKMQFRISHATYQQNNLSELHSFSDRQPPDLSFIDFSIRYTRLSDQLFLLVDPLYWSFQICVFSTVRAAILSTNNSVLILFLSRKVNNGFTHSLSRPQHRTQWSAQKDQIVVLLQVHAISITKLNFKYCIYIWTCTFVCNWTFD